jgi:hypothetical protein
MDMFELVTKAIGALVALASVVYLVGGAVLAGRLTMYSLPWEIVINQLPQSFLVAIGITEVVTPLTIIGLVYFLVLLGSWEVRSVVRGGVEIAPAVEISLWLLVGLSVVLVARLVFHAAGGWDLGKTLIAASAAAFGAAATSLLILRVPTALSAWSQKDTRPLLRSAAVAAAFLPLISWNAMTLPLPYAVTCPAKSQAKANGWLIGQTSDRLILGSTEDDRSRRHITLAPSTDAPIMATYQDPKVFPLPSCPTAQAGA